MAFATPAILQTALKSILALRQANISIPKPILPFYLAIGKYCI